MSSCTVFLVTFLSLVGIRGSLGGSCQTTTVTKLPYTYHGYCDGADQTFDSLGTGPYRIFTYTPTKASTIVAHACDTDVSGQISVQDGCPSGNTVSDFISGCKISPAVQWSATAGTTYYIGISVDSAYPFNLTITDNSLHCEAAVPITSNEFTYHGDTSTAYSVFPPCNGNVGKGLLFSWTPKSSDIDSIATISACDADFNTNIYAWSTTSTTCSQASPTCSYNPKSCWPLPELGMDEYWGVGVQFQVSAVTHYWFLVTGKSTQTVREGKVNVTFSAAPISCDTINITSLPFTLAVNTTRFGYTNSMAKDYAVRALYSYEASLLECSTTLSDTASSDAKYNGDWSGRKCSSFMITAESEKDYIIIASGDYFSNPTFTFRLSARDLVCGAPKQMQILEGGSKNITLGSISGTESNALMNPKCFALDNPAGLDVVQFHLNKPTFLMVTIHGNLVVGLATQCDTSGFATGCYYSSSASVSASLDAGDYFLVPVNSNSDTISNYFVTVTALQMNCSAAKKITSLPFSHMGTTVGAPFSTVSCSSDLRNKFSRGVLYSFTASGAGVFRADVCNGADFSAYVSVFTGCSPNSQTGCVSKVWQGECSNSNLASLMWIGQLGVTYYVWVGSSKSQTGNYNLTVSLYSPPNCSAAIPLTAPVTVTTTPTSLSYMNPCVALSYSYGVLYSITPASDTIYLVNTTAIIIWQGCSNGYIDYCLTGTIVGATKLALAFRGGITSYILLTSDSPKPLALTEISQSECSGGTTISSLPFEQSWNITNAPWYFLHFTPTGEALKGKLFNYTASKSTIITASTCDNSGTEGNCKSKVTVFKDCGSSAQIVGEASENCAYQGSVRWTTTAGTTYFILLSSTTDVDGTFQFRLYESTIVGYSKNQMSKTLEIFEGLPIEPFWKRLCAAPYPIKNSGSNFYGDVAHESKWSNVMYQIVDKTGEVTTLGLTDCAFKIIGNLDIFGVEVVGAAWSTQRQLMYMTAKSSLSTTINLYTVDLDTGRASFVMPVGSRSAQSGDIAYDENWDVLYMFYSNTNNLAKIDLGLGTIEPGCAVGQYRQMPIDFDSCTGILYGSGITWYTGAGLYSLNKHTCEETQISKSSGLQCSDAIDWDLSGVLVNTTYYRKTTFTCTAVSNKGGATFKFNATSTGKLTVTTCSPRTKFDTMIYVFTNCTSSKCIGSNDDAPCSYDSSFSTYTMDVEYNNVYYFFASGRNALVGTLEFSGHLQTMNCSAATTVLIGSSTTESTVGAPLSSISCFPNATDKQGALFVFDGTESASIEASTCTSADFDTEIYLFTGCDHGAIGSCLLHGTSVVWNSEPGISYFIFVTGRDNQTGSFTLTVNFHSSLSSSSSTSLSSSSISISLSESSSVSESSHSGTTGSSESDSGSGPYSTSPLPSSSESSHSESLSSSSESSHSKSDSVSSSQSESESSHSTSPSSSTSASESSTAVQSQSSSADLSSTLPSSHSTSISSTTESSSKTSSEEASDASTLVSSSSVGHNTPAWAAVVIAFGALGCAVSGLAAAFVVYRWCQAKKMSQTFSDDMELNTFE
ncbi:hypothetical protein Pelo_6787 [Pelomyxa schiedti]|nr:hypothetical protein Pelo_6787 [Pelomyxa schiedti]